MGEHQRSYDDFSPAPESCKCDHFNVDEFHCIQSREPIGGAEIEGFAHSFASRVFNWPHAAEGTFVYYKPFLDDVWGYTDPPVAFDAYNPARWMENHCSEAGKGVEMDWMAFYNGVTSSAFPDAPGVQDLFSIYRRTCTGNPAMNCTHTQPVPWASLEGSAFEHYGSNLQNPRYLHFRDTGINSGVSQ